GELHTLFWRRAESARPEPMYPRLDEVRVSIAHVAGDRRWVRSPTTRYPALPGLLADAMLADRQTGGANPGRARGTRRRAVQFEAGIERVAEAVPEQVDGEDGDGDDQPREGREPPGGAQEVAAVAEHGAPVGGRRLDAESEEAQCRAGDDGVGNAERRQDD